MAAPFTLDSMTRKQCVAFGCTLQLRKAAAKEGWRISYHKFPKDDKVREAWLKNLKQSGSEIRNHDSICSLHFKPTDFVMDQELMNKMGIFYKRRLHKDAVPTVFLFAPEVEDPEQTENVESISHDLPMQSFSSEKYDGKSKQSRSSKKFTAQDSDVNPGGTLGNSKSVGIGDPLSTASVAISSKNKSSFEEVSKNKVASTFQYEGKVDPEITIVKTESKEIEKKKIFTMVGLSPDLDLSTSDNSMKFPMGDLESTKATSAKEKKPTQKPLTVGSSGKLQFSCKHCDASFDEELQLELHELVHTGQKPFQCKQCYKMFARKSQLSDHETVHIGEKPQVCTYCGKAYRILSHLQEHLKSHTARHPYKCTYCNKVFIEEHQIQAHLKMHTDGQDIPSRVRKDFLSSNVVESQPFKQTGELQQKTDLNSQKEKNRKQSYQREMKIEAHEPGRPSTITTGGHESQIDGNSKDTKVQSVLGSSVTTINKRSHISMPYTAGFDKPLQLKVPQVSMGNKTSQCTQDGRISAEKRAATDQGEPNTKGNPGASIYDGKKARQTSQLEAYIQAHTGMHSSLYDGKKVRQTSQLEEYIQAHTGTQLHKCTRCEKAFRYKSQMEAHLRTHIEEKPYKCLHCGQVFEFFHALKEHLNLHLNNYNYLQKISQGNRVSTQLSHSRTQMPYQTEQGQQQWQEQTVTLSDRSEDKRYSSPSSPDPKDSVELPYRCTYCVQAFRHIDHLIVHLRSHTGEKPYKCKHCGEAFKEWNTLKRHADMHKRKPHKCTYCGETFKHLNELKRHSLTHRRKQLNDCSKCGQTFRHLDELQRHAETHRGEQPHRCTRCGKTFKRLVEYQMHVWNHTRENAYKCTRCSRRFEKPCYLRAHFRTHTGEKDYKCMVCDRVFSFISILKAHQRTYTGEEPFKCMYCKKTFSQSYILKEHVQQHNEEESPYHCRLCDKPFWLIKALRKHVLKHTGKNALCPHTCSLDHEHKGQQFYKCKEPFECMHCGRAFELDSDLKIHFTAHKVDKLRCLLCRKLFRSRKEFIGYYRSFKRNRPYECTHCRASFCFPHNLARHVLLHTKTCKEEESTIASEPQNSVDNYAAGGSNNLNTVFIKVEEEYDMDLETIVKEEHDVEFEDQKLENIHSSRKCVKEEMCGQDFYKEQLDTKCYVKKEKMDVI